jgi:hypothetical protein
MLDPLLLLLARSLLRVMPPRRVLALLRSMGAKAPPLHTPEEALSHAKALRGGSCLARSLAVAARAPTAQIAIGVEPRHGSRLFAHAWIEMDGRPIDPSEPAGEVIAYLTSNLGSTGSPGAITLERRNLRGS